MKHSLLYIFILAMMTGLLSCSKSSLEQDGGLVSDMPLVFSPTADWPQMVRSGAEGGTKALINNTTELQDYGISLFATATKGKDTSLVFNNDNLYYNSGNGSWDYGSTKYWIPGANYSFAAFAPYATTGEKGTNTISNGTVTVSSEPTAPSITIENYISGKGDVFDARNEDLLYANHSRSDDYSPVELEFEHLLACVSFYIRNATNEDIVKIDTIKLSGLEYKCNWEINLNGYIRDNTPWGNSDTTPFTSDDRTASGEGEAFLPKGMTEQESKPLFDCTELTVLPQQLSGRGITVSFTIHYIDSQEGVNYTGNLSTIEGITRWEAGKKYRYNITISSSEITFQVAEVPWIENNVEL